MSIIMSSYTSLALSKVNCIQAFREYSDRLTGEFVETNIKTFRKLPGHIHFWNFQGPNRQQLIDIAVNIDRYHPNPSKDPIDTFFQSEFKIAPKYGNIEINVNELNFLHEAMYLDCKHCGVNFYNTFELESGKINFTAQGSGPLFVRLKGEGTYQAIGTYEKITKCYKDFKETTSIGIPYTSEMPFFRSSRAENIHTPKCIEYFIGKKKRSINYNGAVRVNIYQREIGTVSVKLHFTHKNHHAYDSNGSVA